jgi:Tfp pilus assembly protein PilE
MRVWGWILALVVVAIAGVLITIVVSPPTTQQVAVSQPAASQPMLQQQVHRFNDSFHRHHDQFRNVSDYSARVRTNRIVALLGFLTFVLLTLPKNTRGAAAFYRQMMATSPLPPDSGATDDNNRRARRVLFFYLLFLLYQLVQFPLTWGRDNQVQFVSDLVIQAFLLIAVAWAYHRLKRGIVDQWKEDPARRRALLGGRLEGINIRWRDIRMMAVGVFIVGFTPSVLSRMTDWLDAFVAFNQRLIGS